jgi:hypothetical protein
MRIKPTFSNTFVLPLTNPTDYPACYRLRCETSADLTKPLPPLHFDSSSAVDPAAGESRTIELG